MVGVYFWKRMRHASDYFTGGHNVPWWLAGVTFYMTGFSAFTFVAYSEMAYRYGFVAVVLAWSPAVAMAVGTRFLAARWRRSRIISPVEFLEARYSIQVRQILAWTGIPIRILDDGLKLYATGVFVSVGMGYDLRTSIIGSGVVMLLYTFMGGLWAVVVTDYVQFIVLTVAVCVLLPLVLGHLESASGYWESIPDLFMAPVSEPFSLLYVGAFYLLIMMSYNGNWAMAQKFYSVRDERAARKAGTFASVLMFVGPPLFIFPAMAARVLMPELMVPPNTPQYTYAALALQYLPAGLMGLMIAAIFAATMSTLSGDYNVVASVITNDVYRRLFDRDASERRLLLVGRIATLLVGACTVAIGVSLIALAQRGLFEVMVTFFGLFVGPTLVPMLLGLVSRWVTAKGAIAGIVCGFASGVGLYVLKVAYLAGQPGADVNFLRYDYEGISIIVNLAVTISAMFIATARWPPSEEEHTRRKRFFDRLDTPIPPRTSAEHVEANAFSPFLVIGVATAGVALLLGAASVLQPDGTGQLLTIGTTVVLAAIAVGFYALSRRIVPVVVQEDAP